MPKVKLSEYSRKQAPPIDWLWAAVLERKMVMGYDLKQLAKVGGVSYEMMRRYSHSSPWEWPRQMRENICDALGLNIKFKPDGLRVEEHR